MQERRVGTWFGHPKGVYLVAFTELWERFSYFGMAALLALYLASDLSSGGWGWGRADAALFYGSYAGLVFAMPVFGGWITNNYLGERRSIVIGALLLMAGHISLGGPAFVPDLIRGLTGIDGAALVTESGAALGRVWALDEVRPALEQAAARAASSGVGATRLTQVAMWSYVGASGSFLFGLLCIILATGLFKAAIASIVGKLYPAGDARRDVGYAVFFTCIYMGAMLANFAVGGLGETFGWRYGFGAAAVGMAIATTCYLWKANEYLGDIGRVPDRVAARAPRMPLSAEERDRICVLILQGAFTTIYAAGFFQKGGLLNLYTHDYVERMLFGMRIPATWFLSVSTLAFMAATPLLAALYLRLARSDRNPSASYKLALGLLILGVAYALLSHAEADRIATGADVISAVPLITMYVLFGIADALVWPNQLALATKLAPGGYTAFTIGAWHVSVGLGTWLAGLIGGAVDTVGNLQIFLWMALAAAVAAGALVLLTPTMRRMMHGAEQTTVAPQTTQKMA
jgi:POT family proton-dependent oligopeptide transporter